MARVPNSEMRVVRDITLDLPQFKCRQQSIVVAHTYGLGNPADAPSRNLQSDIIDSCRALGIRPRYMPTPPTVVGIIKLAAERIRSLTPAERSTSKGHSNFNVGDGPQPISCHKTPPKANEAHP